MTDGRLQIIQGDCREVLRELPESSVQMCVTSPPYWGLRDYGVNGQIGLERTPDSYVRNMVKVFGEVRRVLREDGTLWLNLGDSYTGSGKGGNPDAGKQATNKGSQTIGVLYGKTAETARQAAVTNVSRRLCAEMGAKPKDLVGIPWLVAFALRSNGWYLRSEITWCKRAPMPESVTDRPTSATEKIFLFSKSPTYFYEADAVRTPPSEAMLQQVAEGYNGHATKLFEDNGVQDASAVKSRIINGARKRVDKQRGHSRRHSGFNDRWDHMTKAEQMACGANLRNYWLLGPEPFSEAHFATFPSEIPRRCILLGSKPGDTILDPFGGSGTTGMVALELGRNAILIELSSAYCEMATQRTNVTPGLPL